MTPLGGADCKVKVAVADPLAVAGNVTLPETPDAILPNVMVAGDGPSDDVCVEDAGGVGDLLGVTDEVGVGGN